MAGVFGCVLGGINGLVRCLVRSVRGLTDHLLSAVFRILGRVFGRVRGLVGCFVGGLRGLLDDLLGGVSSVLGRVLGGVRSLVGCLVDVGLDVLRVGERCQAE